MTLDQLRQQLDQLDGEVVALMARRQAIAREVAAAKRATGYPTRDYQREREVVMGVRRRAEALGLSGDLAEKVLRLLIRSSLTAQEQVSVATHGTGSGRRALVIGGAGKMGGWFVQFLVSQGFEVQVADPAGAAIRAALPSMTGVHSRTWMRSITSWSQRRWVPAAPSLPSWRRAVRAEWCSTWDRSSRRCVRGWPRW